MLSAGLRPIHDGSLVGDKIGTRPKDNPEARFTAPSYPLDNHGAVLGPFEAMFASSR